MLSPYGSITGLVKQESSKSVAFEPRPWREISIVFSTVAKNYEAIDIGSMFSNWDQLNFLPPIGGGGAPNLQWDGGTYNFAKFSKKMHEIEKILGHCNSRGDGISEISHSLP